MICLYVDVRLSEKCVVSLVLLFLFNTVGTHQHNVKRNARKTNQIPLRDVIPGGDVTRCNKPA